MKDTVYDLLSLLLTMGQAVFQLYSMLFCVVVDVKYNAWGGTS